jgi:formylglycine-generating enzyme required for sulfatase activity
VSPDSLDFGAVNQSLTLTIDNSGDRTLEWSVAPPAETWIRVQPTSGRVAGTPALVTVVIDRDQAPPGAQSWVLPISSNGGERQVAVRAVIRDNRPVLQVTPVDLVFGETSTSQILTIANAGGGTLNWSIGVPSEGWITLSQRQGASGGVAAQVDVRIDRARAPAGLQRVVLNVTADGGLSQPVILTALIIRPSLSVTPTELRFEASTQNRSLIVANAGTGIVTWRLSASEPWLQLTPTEGRTGEQASTVLVSVDRTRVERDGVYASEVIATSDGGTVTLPVTMVVEGKTPPARLGVSPVVLDFGASSDHRNLGIANLGGSELAWQARSSQAWITIVPDSGRVAVGAAPTQAVVAIDRERLAAGAHQGSVDMVSSGGSASIPVSVSVPAPVIALSAPELDFRTDLDRLTLDISNSGSGDLAWRFEHSLPWLRITPAKGSTGPAPSSVEFAVQRQGLPAGAYDGTVQLLSNAVNQPRLEVRLRLQVVAQPALSVAPDTLLFAPAQDELTLTIRNANNGLLDWQVDAAEAWLSVDPNRGQLGLLEQATVRVSVQRAGLLSGTHAARLTVSSSAGNRVVPVAAMVAQAPRLGLNRTTLDLGTTLTVGAVAVSNTGTGRLTWHAREDLTWCQVQPDLGTTLAEVDTVQVAVDRAGLAPGSYRGPVTFTSDGGELQLLMELQVAATPALSVSHDSLAFGAATATLPLTLTNTGNASVTWGLQWPAVADFVRAVPSSGLLAPGTAVTVQVSVDRAALPLGTHTTALTLAATAGGRQIPLSVAVQAAVLGLSADSLALSSSAPEVQLALSNRGNTALTWTASSAASWLSLAPASGTVPAGGRQQVAVRAQRLDLTPGTYRGALTVSSNDAGGDRVLPVRWVVLANDPPTAAAGPDQRLDLGATADLDGSGSRDPDHDALTFRWTAPAGGLLTTGNTARAQFTSAAAGVYPVVLVVNDGNADSRPDTVLITVARPNWTPVADAGPPLAVVVGTPVTLDGSGSSDPDGDRLTFAWTPPAGVVLSSPTVPRPTFIATAAGVYRFALIVSDGQSTSAPASVVVTVVMASAGPTSPLSVSLPGGASMTFIWVKPGSFTMGAPDSDPMAWITEQPAHPVTLTQGFYLGRYEVTQAQWQAVMNTRPWAGQASVHASPEHPATYIAWDDAQQLVRALNAAAGDSLYRLPTEAEWEYACRAGTSTPWSFGADVSQLGQYAWYRDNAWALGMTWAQPVGSKDPNAWNLYDMQGNVAEWCQDGLDAYPDGAQIDPLVAQAVAGYRVCRGGGFDALPEATRPAHREGYAPAAASHAVGVRLVRRR